MQNIESDLLINEGSLIMFDKQLAEEVGMNEAIFLQQLYYWLRINYKADKNYIEGKYWVYNTYGEWLENNFPFWSKSTLRRTIKNLEKEELVITDNFNKAGFDKTKWYTINFEVLSKIENKIKEEEQSAQNEQTTVQNEQRKCSKRTDGAVQNEQTNTRDYTEITTDNKSKYVSSNDNLTVEEEQEVLEEVKAQQTDRQTEPSPIREAINNIWKMNNFNPNILITLIKYANKSSPELVIEAMKRAKYEDNPFYYCVGRDPAQGKGILNRWLSRGITSISELEKIERGNSNESKCKGDQSESISAVDKSKSDRAQRKKPKYKAKRN
ncbi:hypothetical protein [Natroniella sp. ANB-PHB2]|uniref:hypothetical protein n=1 Tax=Natroniella sp. ANB-PHB2 TaxID=3384444 RepID=UPI0038D4456F